MTTTTTEPDEDHREPATDEAPETADEQQDVVDEQQGEADDESPRDRRYRLQLRAAERERDRLREALLPRLRAEVEQVAGQKLTAGSSIWLLPGLDPLQLVGDDLAVDAKKVTAAAERLIAHAPQLAAVVPSFDAGPRSSPSSSGATWQQALRGR